MEITEQGWGRPAKDEEVEIKLNGIKYNSNKKPYALCEDLEGNRFKINISESDASLQKGRYVMVCTNITPNGYHYVQFERAQDSSWDVYDQNSLADYAPEMEAKAEDYELQLISNAISYLGKMKSALHDLTDEEIDTEAVELYYSELRKELYSAYGRMVWGQKQ